MPHADSNDPQSVREIEQLFNEWFAASERKDLDASMKPISDRIVSYEHNMPLEVRDIATVREECKKGFDQAEGDFRWDIPDLQIHVRGDIAVTWGLNRMAEMKNGKRTNTMWSRGTRVFQRIDGEWKLIHQHVSFPMDPESGKARMDLEPEK
jgi:ketosteroid isomerase-like protein